LSDSAFGISGHKWLRLFSLAIALYVALLPVWWYSLGAISAAAGTCASLIYRFFDDRAAISPTADGVQFVVKGALRSNGLRIDILTYGLPMLVALVIVTRADSVASKLRALAIGCAVMFVLTVCALIAWAKMTSMQIDQQSAPWSDQSSLSFLALHGYGFSQPVVAVLIWLTLIALGVFKGRPGHKRGVAAAGRNAACPCGSGRKYKRCCGA
jgi:hypothetical protein